MVLDKIAYRGRQAVSCGDGRELKFPIRRKPRRLNPAAGVAHRAVAGRYHAVS